jgi:hypothetical protein
MRRQLVAAVATAVMAIAALAGGAVEAGAQASAGAPIGPYAGPAPCADFVEAQGTEGAWDCQYVEGPFGEWYAFTGPGLQGPYTGSGRCVGFVAGVRELGVWDCEYVGGTYAGWYAMKPYPWMNQQAPEDLPRTTG